MQRIKNQYFILPLIGVFFAAFVFFLAGRKRLLEVHFIDVGYGDAIWIRTPESSSILIDAGPQEYGPRLVSYLRSQGVQEIDHAVITHPHANHFQGFDILLRNFPIKQFYINGDPSAEEGYDELLAAIRNKGIPLRTVKEGDRICCSSSDFSMDILHPDRLSGDVNGNSLVCWVRYGESHFLFTADIGEQEQARLVSRYPLIRLAGCVQLPHHGRSRNKEFIKNFTDPILVISTGESRWGAPRFAGLDRLPGTVFRTDLQGTIAVIADGRKMKVKRPAAARKDDQPKK
ncbi:MAG: MBL fold metallo-hydrolase [Candidatus Omnitrophota bacterium]